MPPSIDHVITRISVSATRTIVYCRVSTEKQADRGVSLEAQQARAKAYAELYDLDVVEVVVDAGASAKTLARPGLERALGLLKTGKAEALLVVKLDRLTRRVTDLGRLVERYFVPGKAALLSVCEQIDTRSAGESSSTRFRRPISGGALAVWTVKRWSSGEREVFYRRGRDLDACESCGSADSDESLQDLLTWFFEKTGRGDLIHVDGVQLVRLAAGARA